MACVLSLEHLQQCLLMWTFPLNKPINKIQKTENRPPSSQIYLLSIIACPPRVLSLFHHNIRSSVTLLAISAASQHLIISQSYGSVPMILLEREKRKASYCFWTLFLLPLSPLQRTDLSVRLSLFQLIHPFICIYAKPPPPHD